MAKRKRKSGEGSKLHPIKDYRNDEYVPYIFKAETGILQAWAIESDIRDGDVRQALRGLISSLEKTGEMPKILAQKIETPPESIEVQGDSPETILKSFILNNLALAFTEHGPLAAKDLAGVLRVINGSVGTWNTGMHRQGYLNYIKGFLGGMGVGARRLTPEEVEALGLEKSKDAIEGEDDETE
ncbi:MAG: hypothetical protein JW953_14640 [Anaerolineae bacterium]|nr:hypothetical protein [Anaerolineae bacterium]